VHEHQLRLPSHLKGLSAEQVQKAHAKYGLNTQEHVVKSTWISLLLDILKEPMMIILLLVSALYFILGEYGEAWFMIGAIIIVSGISFYQDNRSRIALQALQELNTPNSVVIRDGILQTISTLQIVPGDLVMAEEGSLINADGKIVYSHDFSVNESILTGEAQAVFKSETHEDKNVFSGTMVSTGLAVYEAEKTGLQSRLGQLGKSLVSIEEEPSPLQRQIISFVRKMSVAGIIVFLIICVVSFLEHGNIIKSLLNGLTLAMSILPEEIPVAFTTFMALGSRRLIRDEVLVKKTRTVETLGSATVICADKTGTITENKMIFEGIYVFSERKFYHKNEQFSNAAKELIATAMWASEPIPFDPMEKSLHELYENFTTEDQRNQYTIIHEYPLGGVPPFMTHIYENQGRSRIIAAKGAPESFLNRSGLSDGDQKIITAQIQQLASKGYRLLGVATVDNNQIPFPSRQQDFDFRFLGLIAFVDPPKPNIREVFQQFYDAGILVKIITGDNAITTQAIASQAGMKDTEKVLDGEQLVKMDPDTLRTVLRETNLLTRMFPEAKLIAINAIKSDHQVVAMIGDGVNDGPALKAANIGIAMGHKGTEIAKNAADLILLNDDLAKLVDAIAAGRRIYLNLKKAVQYIISIHIPIILTVTLPLVLGWIYPNIFTPVHVIFLELIMGPTCSIVYENERIEKNAMQRSPRPVTYSFLNWREMGISFMQGMMITAGIIFMYQYAVRQGGSEEMTRTLVFMTLVLSNIFLTLVNRSFINSFIESMRDKNPLVPAVIGITLGMLAMMLLVPIVRDFFHLTVPSLQSTGLSLLVAAVCVFWFEVWKWYKRRLHDSRLLPANS
jgi:Ca2+-transporting ATPase